MWPLFFARIQRTECPQQAQIAAKAKSIALVPPGHCPMGFFSAKPRAQSMMRFHRSQSQLWQPLLLVTGCSSHCIPSLMLGQYWCDCTAEGARSSSAPQIARVAHEGILIWDLFPAWIAGGQTLDICSSTTVGMKIETSCHFSISNMQKYIHPKEDWHCLYG